MFILNWTDEQRKKKTSGVLQNYLKELCISLKRASSSFETDGFNFATAEIKCRWWMISGESFFLHIDSSSNSSGPIFTPFSRFSMISHAAQVKASAQSEYQSAPVSCPMYSEQRSIIASKFTSGARLNLENKPTR